MTSQNNNLEYEWIFMEKMLIMNFFFTSVPTTIIFSLFLINYKLVQKDYLMPIY